MSSRSAKRFTPVAVGKLRDSANRLRMVAGHTRGHFFNGTAKEIESFRLAIDTLREQARNLDMAANKIEEEAKDE